MAMRLMILGIISLLASCITDKGASQFLGVRCDDKDTADACTRIVQSILLESSFYEVQGGAGTYLLDGRRYPIFFRNRDSAKSPCNAETFENCIISALRYNEESEELVVMLREHRESEPSNDAENLLKVVAKSIEGQLGHNSVRMLGRNFEFAVQ